MDDVISAYKERLHLKKAHFLYIDHDDAMVATVFKVILENDEKLILKICSRTGDYLREAYFLNHFAGKLLSEGVTLFRRKMSLKIMTWINRIAGLIIVGFGIFSLMSIL